MSGGRNELAARFAGAQNDYDAIMVKTPADRLAEAIAEFLNTPARRDWGYGAAQRLSNDDPPSWRETPQ